MVDCSYRVYHLAFIQKRTSLACKPVTYLLCSFVRFLPSHRLIDPLNAEFSLFRYHVKPVPLPCDDWGEDQLIREVFFASVPMPFLLPRVVAIVSSS